MSDPLTDVAPAAPVAQEREHPATEAPGTRDDGLVAEDLLVEDVSIDGMCGVY